MSEITDFQIPKINEELELSIGSLAFGGKGVAKVGDFVVFIRNGLPKQKVLARISKKRRGYAEGVIVNVLQESPFAVQAKCEHFPVCGGCSFQHLNYDEQVEQKKQQVVDIYHRIGGIKKVTLDKVIPAEEQFHYRNKMEFSFSNRRWILPDEPENVDATFALGLHVPRRFDKILDIDTCWIQKPVGNKILQIVKEIARENGLKPYDILKHVGFLRNLVIRIGERTGEVMVNLVTSREEPELLQPIVDKILKEFPEVTSIVNNITRRKAGVAVGEWEVLLYGQSFIHDEIGGFEFEISANSFFQTNTVQGEKLYEIARDFAGFSGDEVLYDLYCGTGSISIFMAKYVKQVYGFEFVPPAVEDAHRNSLANAVFNCRFFIANLDKYFRVTPVLKEIDPPDVIIIDPPRAGMHPKLVNDIILMKPKRIVYISCNPSTQARDVALLQEGGFELKKLAMVDMFPHTPHIETVALLQKT
ncbi:MAG: 23S rRNA (uracil(1939)-C(5))-methyltransferase RlmD [Candidatus Marinimicrobia bacterium]|nr:23S rRNA (uracil(1939)-C(5))-methyltransferase RlmD [Candidatus Neomarinimicrobiota bacterium]